MESSAIINSQDYSRDKSAPRIINNLKKKPLEPAQGGKEKTAKQQAWHGFYTYDYLESESSEDHLAIDRADSKRTDVQLPVGRMWGEDPGTGSSQKDSPYYDKDLLTKQDFRRQESRGRLTKRLSADQVINTIPEVTEEDCSLLLSKYNIEKGGFDLLKSRENLQALEDPRGGFLEISRFRCSPRSREAVESIRNDFAIDVDKLLGESRRLLNNCKFDEENGTEPVLSFPTKAIPTNSSTLHQKTFSGNEKAQKDNTFMSNTTDGRLFQDKANKRQDNSKGEKDFISKLKLEALQSKVSRPIEAIQIPAESIKITSLDSEESKKKTSQITSSNLVANYLEKAQNNEGNSGKPGDLAEEFQKEVTKINKKIDKIFTYLDLTLPEASRTKLQSSDVIEDSSRDVGIPTQKKRIDARRKSNSIVVDAMNQRPKQQEKISIRANRRLTNGSLSRRTNSISDTTSYLRVDLNQSSKKSSNKSKNFGRSVEDKLSTPEFVLEESRRLRKTSPWGDKGYTDLHEKKQRRLKQAAQTKTAREMRFDRRE